MNRNRFGIASRDPRGGWLAALAVLLPAATAAADVNVAYSGPSSYTYIVTHVPDLDQRRSVLPGGGSQYCVPTAAVNWMAYIANHGQPQMDPGPGNWQSQAYYDEASGIVGFMGFLMGTSAQSGTTGNGAMNGLSIWLATVPTIIVHSYATNDWAPRYDNIAQHALNGALVMPVVGWYEQDGLCITRNGGHCLSLTTLARSGSARLIGWRDPAADDGNDLVQSAFATEWYGVEDVSVLLNCTSPSRPQTRVQGYGSGWLDEVFAIYPLFVLTSQPDPLVFQITHAIHLFGGDDLIPAAFASPDGTPIVDLALHSDLSCSLVLAEDPGAGPARLWRVDPSAGDPELIDVALGDPSRLLVGRRRGLYVIDGDDLVCIDLDAEIPVEQTRVVPPDPCVAMSYEDATDEIILLSQAGRIIRYPYHLDAIPDVHLLPASVPFDGMGSIAWDAGRGSLWLISDGSDSLFQLTMISGELVASEIRDDAIVAPEAIDVGDDGRLYVSAQGRIAELVQGATGGWTRAADPRFGDVEAGALLRIGKSRTNFDPDEHGGPEWNNVLPEEFGESVPDCVADLDGSGDVGFGDLLEVLSNWGECPAGAFCRQDLDYSGDVGFSDLLDVLSAWGPCP